MSMLLVVRELLSEAATAEEHVKAEETIDLATTLQSLTKNVSTKIWLRVSSSVKTIVAEEVLALTTLSPSRRRPQGSQRSTWTPPRLRAWQRLTCAAPKRRRSAALPMVALRGRRTLQMTPSGKPSVEVAENTVFHKTRRGFAKKAKKTRANLAHIDQQSGGGGAQGALLIPCRKMPSGSPFKRKANDYVTRTVVTLFRV